MDVSRDVFFDIVLSSKTLINMYNEAFHPQRMDETDDETDKSGESKIRTRSLIFAITICES